MDQITEAGLLEMLDIIYRNLDSFNLIFFKSTGTEYENYIQKFIELEIFHTHRYIKLLEDSGHSVDLDENLIHILCSAMFNGMMEMVDHNMDKKQAIQYTSRLREFYSAGWRELFKL